MKKLLTTLITTLFLQSLIAQIADKVFYNGKIYTAEINQVFMEAIAVKNGLFIYVGSDNEVQSYIGSETIVEDLMGKLVLPGFHDVHQHPLEAGSPNAGFCTLDNQEADPEKLGLVLAECDLEPNSNGWIIANGHSIYTLYEAERDPKYILDEFYPNNPMLVMEETSHSVWVNSKALELLGMDKNTPDPIGGHIFKNEFTNEPTGILLDNAGDFALSAALASNPTIDQLNFDGLVEYSLPLLAENGITSICEARTYWKRNYQQIWKNIKDEGLLTVRVNLAPWIYPSDEDDLQIEKLKTLFDQGDDLLKTNQIKVYSDGITINATAALQDVYLDNLGLPFYYGLNYVSPLRLTKYITELEKIGYDFHIHAIGDRGITEAINSIENARNTNGILGARHRLTHLEIVNPVDYNRFENLNIIADMQVAGIFTNPEHWHENDFLIGSERSENLIPLKSIFDTGATITLSSDWDVSSVNPFVGIQNALTREPQAIPTVKDAINAYTINGAYTMRQEDKTGSIKVGKLADFICVNQDVFTIPKTQISNTKVLSTHLSGAEIYRSAPLSNNKIGINKNQVQIFPNPAIDKIIIKTPNSKIDSLSIYNLEGQLLETIIIKDSALFEKDIANYPKGTYFITIKLINGSIHHVSFLKN